MATPCTCDTFNSNLTVNGSVGVGTSTPRALLSFGTPVQTNVVYLYDAGGGAVYGFGIAPNTLQIYSSGAITTAIAFGTYDGTTFAEGMRLQGGKLGIGTTNPTQPLSVAGTISYNSGSSGAVGLVDNDNHFIRSNGVGAQVFANNWGIASQGWIFRDDAHGADRVVIQGNGLVGIGTDSPTQPLHLQGGSLYINGGAILVSGDVTTGVGSYYAASTKVADSGGCYYGN